ncbi:MULTISPECIES: DUF397 domain-containing protein [Streptomyces]|uniref:DUF397 domain-containing protein n=1 Tax=Streptomyces TaxID=1883 RepID=UPI00136E754A|nr:DUF397 domain-containing protein [Streptomyces sp. SID6139]MYR19771.1 DUF397 domain-containing protein [Streptomyces sp. SID6137]
MSWFKSTYSSGGDGDCVEVALVWHKSSYSSGSGDDCVEVAAAPATIHVRDSKAKRGAQLAFCPTTWSTFVSYAAETEPQH